MFLTSMVLSCAIKIKCIWSYSQLQSSSVYVPQSIVSERERQLTSRAPGAYFLIIYFVSCFNCVCEQISETTVCQVYQNEIHTVLSLKQAIGKKQNTRGC